jgi:hypothetical protein
MRVRAAKSISFLSPKFEPKSKYVRIDIGW